MARALPGLLPLIVLIPLVLSSASANIRALSTSSPLSTILNTHPNLTTQISSLLHHFSTLPAATCVHTDPAFTSATSNYLTSRGWPPPSSCIKRQIHPSPHSLYNLINHYLKAYTSLFPTLARRFPEFTPVITQPYHINSLPCTLSTFAAVRLNHSWFISIGFTNQPSHFYAKDGERVFVNEYLKVTNGVLKPALMHLPDDRNRTLHNVTTSISSWPGAALPGHFYPSDPATNVAVRDAMHKGRLAFSARGIFSNSNAITLFLPCLLVFIPYAAIAKVVQTRLLLWTFTTNVLTILPVIIHGVNLALWETHQFVSIITEWTTGKTRVAQLSAASCALQQGPGRRAITLGIALMALGISLEWLALQRRKSKPSTA